MNPATRHGHVWSPSYFAASCGGAPLAIIRQYIEQQRHPA
jgi:putative transposase